MILYLFSPRHRQYPHVFYSRFGYNTNTQLSLWQLWVRRIIRTFFIALQKTVSRERVNVVRQQEVDQYAWNRVSPNRR